jgi:hypothetical protein
MRIKSSQLLPFLNSHETNKHSKDQSYKFVMRSVTFSSEICEFSDDLVNEDLKNNHNSSSTFTPAIRCESILSKNSKYPRYSPDDDYPCKLLRGGNYLIVNRHGKVLKLIQSQWHDNTWFAGKAQQAIEHHSQQMAKRRELRLRDLGNDKENLEPLNTLSENIACVSSDIDKKPQQNKSIKIHDERGSAGIGSVNCNGIGDISDLILVVNNTDNDSGAICQSNSQHHDKVTAHKLSAIGTRQQLLRRCRGHPIKMNSYQQQVVKRSVDTTTDNGEEKAVVRRSTKRKLSL